jgi:3-deoxy-D-manno-octulosonic-acid transferase
LSGLASAATATIWLHADTAAHFRRLESLSGALLAEPGFRVLLTHPGLAVSANAHPMQQMLALTGDTEQLRALLDTWTPDGLLLAVEVLPSTILAVATQAGLPVLIANMPEPAWRGLRMRLPGNRRNALRNVRHVFLTAEATRPIWTTLLSEDARLTTVGPLGETPRAPACNDAERDALAVALRHRPVWLSLATPEPEEAAIIAAHREALRASHRLLLVLHPTDPQRGAVLREGLARDFQVAQRSADDPLLPETQIYIADTEAEHGLWCRLASVCFMGGTLSGTASAISPLEPACLGCAVVHGPRVQPYQDAYKLLSQAGAVLGLQRADGLGAILCEALRPDIAADLAHRAWQVLSEGAEAQATIIEALLALPPKEQP